MAVHGVSRSTHDVDLLALDPACLAPSTWAALTQKGVSVDIRRGDADDPLAGVVQLAEGVAAPIDLVVGRSAWQAGVLDRATSRSIEDSLVPVASATDLILLKLYAAGPQDAWDVEQLLAAGDRESLIAHVQMGVAELPEDARRLWARIVRPR
jgi:hypothetical protein